MQIDVGGLVFDTVVQGDEGGEVVLLLHGFPQSSWCWRYVTPLLVDAGYLVFAADYREAPDSVFPASRDDVLAAERWAVASEWAFDRSRLAFFGGSAGGNLVVEAAPGEYLTACKPGMTGDGIRAPFSVME